MRVTTLLRRLIGVTELFVEDCLFTLSGQLSVTVRPRWRLRRCGECGRRAPGFDTKHARYWKHLPFGSTPIALRYEIRRVDCPHCGVRVEQVPWAAHDSRFTYAFEEFVAYLAQITDKTKVTKIAGIAWATVGSIVERVVERRLDPERLEGLRHIGVDEFSYRKRHRYLTVVVDHDRRRVIWAAEGKSSETLEAFFDQLGPKRCRAIRLVTMDMAGGYIKAVRAALPRAQIVFDRFHRERLVHDAVDEVRRSLVRQLEGTPEAKQIKGLRYTLLKHPTRLGEDGEQRLEELEEVCRPLYRAWLLKECFAEVFEESDPELATTMLEGWISWASESGLAAFEKAAETMRKHRTGIVAYFRTRLTNATVEGFNAKARMVARRAYGFHSAGALISMIFLVCGGIELNPPLPTRS